jgi:FkbM family methyltransferase
MISYAQNFEDVMLERLFAGQERGFYVDVGAWDPDRLSTTKHFYLRGWRGINIEPIESRFRMFRETRPHDANLNVAIAAEPGETVFWICREDDSRSTAETGAADALKAEGLTLLETRVPTRRLDEIFAEQGVGDIDFLKIDVEGLEAEVIGTMAFERWRPRVLVIEATRPAIRPDWSNPEAVGTWQSWEPNLLARSYAFAHFDGLNRFYVRSEEKHLAARLSLPPGVFDDIEESGLNAGRSGALLTTLTRSEAESSARLEVMERLNARLKALEATLTRSEAESCARLEEIERLNARLKALEATLTRSEAESCARLEEIERLNARLKALEVELEELDRPSKALSHLGYRLGVAIAGLRSPSGRSK